MTPEATSRYEALDYARHAIGFSPRGIVIGSLLAMASAISGNAAMILIVPLLRGPNAGPASAPALPRWNGLVDRLMNSSVSIESATLLFLVASIAFAALHWLSTAYSARLEGRYASYLRNTAYNRLIATRLDCLADSTSAEIANALTYNVEILAQGFSCFLQLILAVTTFVLSILTALCISPALTLLSLLGGALALFLSRMSGRNFVEAGRNFIAAVGALFWLSEDFPGRFRQIRTFGQKDSEISRFSQVIASLEHYYVRQQKMSATARLEMEILAALGISALVFTGAKSHWISQANLLAILLLLGRLLPYLMTLRKNYQQMSAAAPALALWLKTDALPKDQSIGIPAPVQDTASGQGELLIEKLSLSLHSHRLEISGLRLCPGELTVVLGDSGIGKSSVCDVLAGLRHPEEFEGKMAGQSIDYEAYRRSIRRAAYIGQGVKPWQNTVRECLSWADPAASEAALWEVLEIVGLAAQLRQSREGLETALGSTANRFSGGETQRLLLAQVMLRKPRFVILDEATSALDDAAENALVSALVRHLGDAVIIFVTHRNRVQSLASQCISFRRTDQRLVAADIQKTTSDGL